MEYLSYAFTGINILPSILLIIVILYWVMTILGIFSVDSIDFDFDGDLYFDGDVDIGEPGEISTTSFLGKIVEFSNMGAIPFMIYFSILVLALWILSMLTYYLNIQLISLIALAIFVQNIIIAFLLTKLATEPMKGFFLALEDHSNVDIIGQNCTMKNTVSGNTIGQGEIMIKGYPIVINVKSSGGEIKKSEQAKVMSKDEEKNLYIVKKL